MEGIQGAGLQATQAGMGADQARHRRKRHRPDELLSWSIQTLMGAEGEAKKKNNPGEVVSTIRQLDHMTAMRYLIHRGHGVQR